MAAASSRIEQDLKILLVRPHAVRTKHSSQRMAAVTSGPASAVSRVLSSASVTAQATSPTLPLTRTLTAHPKLFLSRTLTTHHAWTYVTV